MRPKFPPIIILLVGILAISSGSILVRGAQQEAHSLVIAAYRLCLASLILAPIALTRYRTELLGLSKRKVLLAFASGALLGLHFLTWITSLEFTTVASSTVLVTTSPLFVGLLAPLVLKEPVGKVVFVGLVIALLGGILIGLADACRTPVWLSCPPLAEFVQGRAILGDLLALAGAGAAAGYWILGRQLQRTLALTSYIFLVYSMGALLLLGLVLVMRLPVSGYSSPVYLWFVLLAVLPQLIGHTSFNWALRYLPVTFVSITMLGEPIGATILALFILQEVPSLLQIVGGGLILGGIMIASHQKAM